MCVCVSLCAQGTVRVAEASEFRIVVNISAPNLQEAYGVQAELTSHNSGLLLQVVSDLYLVCPFAFCVSFPVSLSLVLGSLCVSLFLRTSVRFSVSACFIHSLFIV